MLICKAYRYELDPNNSQRPSLFQHAGVARFAYNWGFEQRIMRYKNNQDDEPALNLVTVSLPETQTACGEDVRLQVNPLGLTEKQISMKQELNISHGS